MDDLLVSVDSIEKAKALSSELQTLLTKGSFNLTKWASNESEVFEDRMTPEKNPTVLGLEWLLHSDELKVCRGVSFDVQQQWTQREVLSNVSSLFDPLGFVVPFSIRGKLIMKRIWQTQGQQWDKPIEESLQKSFNSWISELPQNNPIAPGRWYKMNSDDKKELHVFGDASEDAFCAYVVSVGADYRHVSFAMGKATVAPMKHHTIPKLELMAVVTAMALKQMLIKEHECNFGGIFMWTDLTTVLQWIRNIDRKQPVFVANRVAEVLDSTTVDQWNHINGVKNPADLGTRGISYPELMESDWLQGPHWLKQEDWISLIGQGLIEEQQQVDNHFEDGTASEQQMFVGLLTLKVIDWKIFSQFNRLKFMIMRILKLFSKYRGSSLVDLLKLAEFKFWSLVQQENSRNEIISLKKTMSVHSKSKMIGLLTFLDSNGIMRAKGRLRKADMEYQTKHPVFLPNQNWASEEQRVMAVGDLVWICDKQCHPFKYPLGKVLELHTGDDSISRSATVRTHRVVLKRPLVSLVPIEIDRQDVILVTKNRAGDVAVRLENS